MISDEKEDSGGINANGHEYIDLGLPSGLLWSPYNIGANTEYEYGAYYAWGELEEKVRYAPPYFDSTFEIYNTSGGLTELLPEHDIVVQTYGGGWRMPNINDFQELKDNCTFQKETLNGIVGMRITSKNNNNSLFFPYSGYKNYTSLFKEKESFQSWSSTLGTTNDLSMSCANYSSHNGLGFNSLRRYSGCTVRGVLAP